MRQPRRLGRRALVASAPLLALPATSGRAVADSNVDLLLALAVDASGSVNQARFDLQRDGYAAAFRHPRLVRAISSGAQQAIAVAMFQWTGPALQALTVPWTVVRDAASAAALASAIEAAPRRLFSGGTSISGALDFGAALIAASPLKPLRRIIDVSGDGSNNNGRSVTAARDTTVAAGIRINGLPILSLEPTLDIYFRENVIGGPGAFVVAAASYETFAEAILLKLVLEIADGARRATTIL
jgi:hypothetical protein